MKRNNRDSAIQQATESTSGQRTLAWLPNTRPPAVVKSTRSSSLWVSSFTLFISVKLVITKNYINPSVQKEKIDDNAGDAKNMTNSVCSPPALFFSFPPFHDIQPSFLSKKIPIPASCAAKLGQKCLSSGSGGSRKIHSGRPSFPLVRFFETFKTRG